MKTNKNFLNYFKKDIPLSAFLLTALAAILMTIEGLFWAYNQSLFAVRFDAIDLLLHFGSAAVLALCAVLLLRQPPHNRILGFSIGIFALTSVIAGGGFLAGFVIGIVGGVIAFTWRSNMRLIRPLNNRLMKLSRKNRAIASLAVVVIAFLIVMPTELTYQLYISSIEQQTLSGSKLINTPHGLIEYADVGEGYPVLVSHGGLMGYDQIESVRQMLGNKSFRLIVPSRFGYLRTPLPSDASVAAQADAFADLLDALNVSKVIMMGFSFGGPSALQFSLRYPDRTSALVMSMAVSHNTPPLDFENQILQQVILRSDLAGWAFSASLRPQFLALIGVSSQVQANMMNADKQYVDDMLRVMQPMSARQAGMYNDRIVGQAEINLPLENIKAPTLVFHAKDDGLVNFEFGQYTARHIPDAKIVPFESGGHLLVGRLGELHNETMSFLRENKIIP
jgi:2-hydroxy-6-oxonona-2,4-dienedioate hydrolase